MLKGNVIANYLYLRAQTMGKSLVRCHQGLLALAVVTLHTFPQVCCIALLGDGVFLRSSLIACRRRARSLLESMSEM